MQTGRRNNHELYRQAGTGGVLLSSMGNPKPYPVYWDKLLINASQVINPSIDPLREPMEIKTHGEKSRAYRTGPGRRNYLQSFTTAGTRYPVMFSAMSYGSISYNAHEEALRGQRGTGIPSITQAKAACTRIFTNTVQIRLCRLRPDALSP